MKTMKQERGFLALLTAVIISAVVLLVVVSSSITSIYGRFNVLDFELKERSAAAADACADIALLLIAEGTNPDGATLTLNDLDSCRVGRVSGSAQQTFRVQATSSNAAVTNLEIVADTADISIISWKEIAVF